MYRIREGLIKLPDNVSIAADRIFYLGLHLWDDAAFGVAKTKRLLTEGWLENTLTTPLKMSQKTLKLSDVEIASIPGAKEVMDGIETLQLDGLQRKGTSFDIKDEDIKYWMSQGEEFSEPFRKLLDRHNECYRDLLRNAKLGSDEDKKNPGPEGDDEDRAGMSLAASSSPGTPGGNLGVPEAKEFDSMVALQAADPVEKTAVADVNGVEILRGASGKTYLLSKSGNRTIPKKVQLGSFGTGCYVDVTDPGEGLLFDYPAGDKTLVQVWDLGNTGPWPGLDKMDSIRK